MEVLEPNSLFENAYQEKVLANNLKTNSKTNSNTRLSIKIVETICKFNK
jgi:hypothetical protein